MSKMKTKLDNNFVVKVLSLLSAIALWFFVMNEQNPIGESTFNVPVSVIDVPEGMKVTLEEDVVSLKLRAPRSLFAAADKTEMKVIASLAGMEENNEMVKLHAIVPQGFELVGMSPDRVMVQLEQIVEKQFEVSLIRAGAVSPDMSVAATVPKQRIVTVTGPQSQVEKITRVIGYVGLTADRKEDFVLQVPLSPVSADGKGVEGVKLSMKAVPVEVQLVKGLTKKTLDIKPVFDGTLTNGYSMGKVSVTPSRVEVAGPAAVMNGMSVVYTDKIPLDELTKSEKRRVGLILPDGVSAAVEQVTVELEIRSK